MAQARKPAGPSISKKLATVQLETGPLPTTLPEIPVPPKDFLKYLAQNKDQPVRELLQPFVQYENVLRRYLAQDPEHEFVKDNTVNLVSIFEGNNGKELTIRARDMENETPEEAQKYMMPLTELERRKTGEPCLQQDMATFRKNFAIFTESSLANMDWSNVVCAGSAVLTPLLVVPKKYRGNTRALRKYYHELLAPASDIDLFIYGIDNEEEAIKKMEVIEKTIRDNLLWETTTIRTRNTITIVSQYPNRHVQIVLRLYKSISQILTGFDVNCSCFAYDGKRVLANPRALAACITQCNDLDLTRRSPSYENRLSKYSKRGFEVYCPFLDRSRIDPTIFERSFARTMGLARLLVLEAMPSTQKRSSYQTRRREETGRLEPPGVRYSRHNKNRKDTAEDDVPEWDFEEHNSNYGTFAIPYGEGYNAKNIEKKFFQTDLLLNAEWNAANRPPERMVNLHRHPVFIGDVKTVVVDCCGFCPEPQTEEEKKVAEEEAKKYVSGKIKMLNWLGDDPGRQEVGSFHPLGPEDYTDMAYVGTTARLCEAIVDNDVDGVKAWLNDDDHADVNGRDFCGRTPLHLACQNETTGVEVVQVLLDHGARICARVADGKTALHIAAARGAVDIVSAILKKSAENEQLRDEREQRAKRLASVPKASSPEDADVEMKDSQSGVGDDFEDISMADAQSQDAGTEHTSGFVKVKPADTDTAEDIDQADEEDEEDEDDILDINVEDWDNGMSALHYAIVEAHIDVVTTLISEFGADSRKPRKVYHIQHDGAISTKEVEQLVMNFDLALSIKDMDKRREMVATLLKCGLSCAQMIRNGQNWNQSWHTAFHKIVQEGDVEMLKMVFELDAAGAMRVINNTSSLGTWSSTPVTPLVSAMMKDVKEGREAWDDQSVTRFLISKGAHVQITWADSLRSLKASERERKKTNHPELNVIKAIKQPIEWALELELPVENIRELITAGADPSTILKSTTFDWGFGDCTSEHNDNCQRFPDEGFTPLDWVRNELETHRKELDHKDEKKPAEMMKVYDESELADAEKYPRGSYTFYMAQRELLKRKEKALKFNKESEEENKKIQVELENYTRRKAAFAEYIKKLEETEKMLLEVGAKTYHELHPEGLERLKNKPPRNMNILGYSSYYQRDYRSGQITEHNKGFKVGWSFRGTPQNGESDVIGGYVKLFEAVWRGAPEDREVVRQLTGGTYKLEGKTLPPLLITATDMDWNAPLSIALQKRDYEMVELILEIVKEQYVPKEEVQNAKYREARKGRDSDDHDSEDDDEDSQESDDRKNTHVRFEKVAVGDHEVEEPEEIVKHAVCHVSPWAHFRSIHIVDFSDTLGDAAWQNPSSWSYVRTPTLLHRWQYSLDPLTYAIKRNDTVLLEKFFSLIRTLPTPEDIKTGPHFGSYLCSATVDAAIERSDIPLLERLMRTCTFGLPYHELEAADPVVQREKQSKYYQGLSIRGKKKTKWVQEANPNGNQESNHNVVNAMHSAICSNSLEVVQWLHSDRPWACIQEFMQSNAPQYQKEIRLLKGKKQELRTWCKRALGVGMKHVLHTLIYKWDASKSPALVRHIVEHRPRVLEERSKGKTPALAAIQHNAPDAAKLLLSLGANFAARDSHGRNVLHLLTAYTKLDEIKRWFDIIPADIIDQCWTQRLLDVRSTPLLAIAALPQTDRNLEIIKFFLSKSGGRELRASDCRGEMAIHKFFAYPDIVRLLLSYDPTLLYTENALGLMPTEMHKMRFLPSQMARLLDTHPGTRTLKRNYSAKKEDPNETLEAQKRLGYVFPDEDGTRKLVREIAERDGPGRRVLCKLQDANELARRVWYEREREREREAEERAGKRKRVQEMYVGRKRRQAMGEDESDQESEDRDMEEGSQSEGEEE